MPDPTPVAASDPRGVEGRLPAVNVSLAGAARPALLTMASYHGTLAAARCLGEAGIPVTIADTQMFAPARWSRFATRRTFCPSVQDAERFVSWLLEFGERHPGHVLYPTGDDVAWLYALHHAELAKQFHLYQPSVEVIYTLLNKERLRRACTTVGIDMPQTWLLGESDDVGSLAAQLPYPVLVKPQTQILFWPHAKGRVVRSPEGLRSAYDELVRDNWYSPVLLAYDPGVVRPLIQVYLSSAVQSIYNLSGFVDETGDLFVVRASRKVLQRPRLLGVGLCFEEAEVDDLLAEKIRALCRRVGYYGVFEVEFIDSEGEYLLIDFNPRYYGQMAFDIARDLPLPLLTYHAALGRRAELRAAVERARARGALQGRAYCNRFELNLLLGTQRLAGLMDEADRRRWTEWLAVHQGKVTDSVGNPGDRKPRVAQVAGQLLDYARHPRSFFKQFKYEP